MKKFIGIIVLVLMFAVPAFSQTMNNLSTAIVGWDAAVLPAPGTMKYQVYSRNDLVSTGVKVGSEITATQASLIFSPYTTYYVGVESVFYPTSNPTVPDRSVTKAWSNNVADCSPAGAFGFFYTPGVNPPTKLRLGLLGQLKSLVG